MAEDEDDPFDAFETPDDDTDPFEDLHPPESEADSGDADREPDQTSVDPDAESSAPGRLPDDPFDRDPEGQASSEDALDPDASSGDDAAGDDPPDPTDDPFSEFSTAPRDDGDDPFAAFESAGVDEIDPDAVWEDLASGGPDPADRTYSEVSKHRFCETCEHFSPPPDVECTYEGAAIVEFLDTETVRLLNCPVVAEQRALEGSGVDLGADSE